MKIQFKIDQLKDEKDVVLLTKRQFQNVERHIKNNTGFRIELSYNQYWNKCWITPYVRKGAPIVKNDVIPVLRNMLDWVFV